MDGRNTGRMGFSHAAEDSAENMMAAVKAGKIRKHLMGNTSPIRYGTMEKRDLNEIHTMDDAVWSILKE